MLQVKALCPTKRDKYGDERAKQTITQQTWLKQLIHENLHVMKIDIHDIETILTELPNTQQRTLPQLQIA